MANLENSHGWIKGVVNQLRQQAAADRYRGREAPGRRDSTVRSWRLKGVGARFLKLGRAVRYRPQDVDDYERQALVETQGRGGHGPM